MLHPSELCCTLLGYAAPYWATLLLLSYASPSWASLHPPELRYLATLQPVWATLYPQSYTRCTLLSYAVPYWATLHPKWATVHAKKYSAPPSLPSQLRYNPSGKINYIQRKPREKYRKKIRQSVPLLIYFINATAGWHCHPTFFLGKTLTKNGLFTPSLCNLSVSNPSHSNPSLSKPSVSSLGQVNF